LTAFLLSDDVALSDPVAPELLATGFTAVGGGAEFDADAALADAAAADAALADVALADVVALISFCNISVNDEFELPALLLEGEAPVELCACVVEVTLASMIVTRVFGKFQQ